jgi:release factor glutamine methyltransferase
MTLRQAAAGAAATLAAAGIEDGIARRDAGLLARHTLGWDAARWLADNRMATTPAFTSRFQELIARRAAREPVAYIVGEREFHGRSFAVTPDVLIPRPETELVLEAALESTRGRAGIRMVDVGAGSGCLAIGFALERTDARVIATDSSDAALAVARRNARRYGVDDRIEWRRGDLLAGVHGPFDLIVSNPPYVAERDRAGLQPEVERHEPAAALFGGADGLDVIRRLVPAAAAALSPGGWLVFEIGFGQAGAVEAIVNHAIGLRFVRCVNDLQSIPRVVMTRRDAQQDSERRG